jgi:putative PIN family toxin of toxin-antitoxin system
MRFVFDTNVLIDGLADDFNAQTRLIEAVCDGEIEALATPQTEREYRRIIGRFTIDSKSSRRLKNFLDSLIQVQPGRVENIVIDDSEDIKFINAALGGQADAIITNDHHLLDLGEIGTIRILKPLEAWAAVEDETGGSNAWQQFIRGLGISR